MRVIKNILTFINRIIPKKNQILFHSFPDMSDSSKAIYEYLLKNRRDICRRYELLWGIDDEQLMQKKEFSNIAYVKKKSLKGYWEFLRSKYVISTHGYFSGVYSGKGQVQLNTWHGCGFKADGGETGSNDLKYRGDYTLVSGPLYTKINADIMGLSSECAWVTGFPRNDLLFDTDNALKKLGIDRAGYKNIIIWMPTYRKSVVGSIRKEGNTDSFGAYSLFDKDILDIINSALKESDSLLILKPHPMDELCTKKLPEAGCVRVVKNQDLVNAGVSLYQLIGETDALISDYSSVAVDYLLLEKPIAFLLTDETEYKNDRGFVFEPIEDYLPGAILKDYGTFLDFIKKPESGICSNKMLIDKMVLYKDNNNTKRVVERLFDKE